MKVIDLLNKIANGELKDLTLVKFCKNDCSAKYHKTDERFEFIDKGDWDNYFNLIDIAELNDEVEIIEEDKKIEKISWKEKESLAGTPTQKEQLEILARRSEKIKKVLNELIDEVNKIKESK